MAILNKSLDGCSTLNERRTLNEPYSLGRKEKTRKTLKFDLKI